MDEGNRFAPPLAQVADVAHDGEVQPIRLWPPSGRIGRLRFLAYGLGLYAIFGALSVAWGYLAAGTSSVGPVLVVLGYVGLLAYFVAAIILIIQRSHDMNLSGWWTLAAFIPLVGLVWVFKAGTRGANRWGAPPPPNGLAVRVFGLLLPIVFTIGIVAAIVIPADQAYAVRAGAAPPR
jgi:uncharacterized membrane protein YhaH (DUF805 family)